MTDGAVFALIFLGMGCVIGWHARIIAWEVETKIMVKQLMKGAQRGRTGNR